LPGIPQIRAEIRAFSPEGDAGKAHAQVVASAVNQLSIPELLLACEGIDWRVASDRR
jgi:hypothetical protein